MNQEFNRMTLTRNFWESGFCENLILNKEGLLAPKNRAKRGLFFSRAIDLAEEGMSYHRLVMDCARSQDSNIQIGIRTSDVPYIVVEGQPVDTDAYLMDLQVSIEGKRQLFLEKGTAWYANTKDMLLHQLEGRYLWICLSILDIGEATVGFSSLSLEFPRESFVDYLPEIYQDDSDFLRRYLGIFQSIYLDMERQIDKLPVLLDPDTASGEILDYLAFWLGIENEGNILNPKQFRYMVKNAVALNKAKGTVKSIVDMVRLYTGEEPFIVEYFEIQKYVKNDAERQQLYHTIYMDNPYTFCIILKNGSVFEKGGSLDELSRLVDKVRPAHTIARIIVLNQSVRLDRHSYIGINTCLEKRLPAALDGGRRMDGSIYLNA